MSYSTWQLGLPQSLNAARILCYDSEFVRERHYYPKLALLQLYQPDWAQVQLCDPMQQAMEGLWAQLAAHEAPLVLHAGSQDIELMYSIGGVLPRQIRDTQIGFALCYPQKAISYADMVAHYLGILLPKSETRSDWLARPLSAAQCDYAADDVSLLAQVYPLLVADLQALGRLTWWQEECARQLAQALAPPAPLPWYKLRGAPQHLRTAHYAAAQALVDIREQIAAAKDLPRRKVLSDEDLVAAARRQPENALDLAELLPPRHPILQDSAAIETAFARYRQESPPIPERSLRLAAREQSRYQKLEKYVHRTAAALNISDEMLATPRQMREWLKDKDNALLNQGWRAAFFQSIEL